MGGYYGDVNDQGLGKKGEVGEGGIGRRSRPRAVVSFHRDVATRTLRDEAYHLGIVLSGKEGRIHIPTPRRARRRTPGGERGEASLWARRLCRRETAPTRKK